MRFWNWVKSAFASDPLDQRFSTTARRGSICYRPCLEQLEDRITPAITLNPTTLVPATLGVPYAATITATGAGANPIFVDTLSATGLSFVQSGKDYNLSGTPTMAGGFPFTVTVGDAADTESHTTQFALTISPAPLTINQTLLHPGTVGVSYKNVIPILAGSANDTTVVPFEFTATGGSGSGYVFSATGLPTGLTLSSSGGLAGTPTLAGSYTTTVTVVDGAGASASQSYTLTILPSLPGRYTPQQVQQAYGINQIILSGGIRGDGSGETVVIIEENDAPNFVSSTGPGYSASDLSIFNSFLGLRDFGNQPGAPVFLKLGGDGSTNLPTATGDIGETSQDIEWVHAVAPGANIIVLEFGTNSLGKTTTLKDALDTVGSWSATNNPNGITINGVTMRGVSVVSYSAGGSETSLAFSADSDYAIPGVTVVASAGDRAFFGSRSGVLYPAVSKNVLAAGETELVTDAQGNYIGELGVSNTGAGISLFEPQPSFQNGVVSAFSTTHRTTPDVGFVGSSNSAVAVYNSLKGGWSEGNGTSLAAPAWAGLLAIANQGRTLLGQPTLDGPTETLPLLYSLVGSDSFHAITRMTDGSAVSPFYNLHTGMGSPVANILIPTLLGGVNSIDGSVVGTGNVGLAGQTVFFDFNNNGIQDPNEASATTNANGSFRFANLPPGTYLLREIVPSGLVSTTAISFLITFTGTGQNVLVNFQNSDSPETPGPDFINNNVILGLLQLANGQLLLGNIFDPSAAQSSVTSGSSTTSGLPGSLASLAFGADTSSMSSGTNAIGEISGQVFVHNAGMDMGEKLVAGVTLDLELELGGVFVAFASTTTDKSGQYAFTGLPAGRYRVRAVSGNYKIKVSGANQATDSDAAPTGKTSLGPSRQELDSWAVLDRAFEDWEYDRLADVTMEDNSLSADADQEDVDAFALLEMVRP